MCELLTPHL